MSWLAVALAAALLLIAAASTAATPDHATAPVAASGATPGAPPATTAVLSPPYLQFGGTVEAPVPVVRWFASPAAAGRLLLGVAGRPLAEAGDSPAGPRHAVALAGLLPDTLYTYRVVAGAETTAAFTFRTLPARARPGAAAPPVTFVIYGDNRSRPEWHHRVLDRIRSGPRPLFVLNTGDLLESGPDSLGWHREFFAPGAALFAEVPVLAVPGNHELDRSRRPRALARWWADNLTLPANGTDGGEDRWWALRAGGCLLIGLDSNEPEAPGQREWLAATLAAAGPDEFVIVACHHPLYAAGGHDSDQRTRAAWRRLLDSRRVDVVFCGHNHFYQRSWPLRAGTVVSRRPSQYRAGLGTIYCVAGGGGAPLYSPEPAPFVAASSQACHHVLVRCAGGRLECTAIDVEGREIDRFVIVK